MKLTKRMPRTGSVSRWFCEVRARTLEATLPEIARAGARIMIARLVLKVTMPGIPDVYQGCELEDFSLVDPDNRRAVDYGAREAALVSEPEDWSTFKLHILRAALRDRAQYPLLYARGGYEVVASKQPDLLCFRRKHDKDEMLVAVQVDPFCARDPMDDVSPMLVGESWSNLLEGHALEQRKHGGQTLPAVVLRKSH